jgi:flavin-dependent dehydrogenase
MEHHEVVIVGAGPAGLKAAELLTENGKDFEISKLLIKNK